jgi:tetratricopeptide (TPR) repeat protein
MSNASLSQSDIADLQSGSAMVQSGEYERAIGLLGTVAQRTRHPEALHLFGYALAQAGRRDDACKVLVAVLELAPRHAHYWNSYGSLLNEKGDRSGAADALRHAVTLNPDLGDAWLNLGIVHHADAKVADAVQALQQAVRLLPNSARPHVLLGKIADQSADHAGAEGHFQNALRLNPGDSRVRHNLARALRLLNQEDQALVEIERAIADGSQTAESYTLRAHLLAECGETEKAIEQYQTTIARFPEWLDAHETLARLLPQAGRPEEALASYRRILEAGEGSEALWLSAMTAAKDLGDADTILQWSADGRKRFGDTLSRSLLENSALQMLGEHERAITALNALSQQYPGEAAVQLYLSHSALCLHDPHLAQRHAEKAVQIAPHNQTGWAHLSVIWRMLDDPREEWLADYDRLVIPLSVELPVGLSDTLTDLHTMRFHPAEQSLRGGTQTRGNLFDRQEPDIRALVKNIQSEVEAALVKLPVDTSHPFLSRLSKGIDFTGSWSVRLQNAGYHINHIHPQGWLSSALYVQLPGSISQDSGSLVFGVPDASFGLDWAPRRIELPEVGKIVIFPSYLWHGTRAFTEGDIRMSVAFDALPASVT